MAASDAWRPLHPVFGSSQKTGMIPGDSVGFCTLTCRNSSAQNESPVSKLRGSHLSQFHTASSLRDGSTRDITRGSHCVVTNLPPASVRFSLPTLQRSPKSPPTPTPRYPCSGSKVFFAHQSVCIASGGGFRGFEPHVRSWGRGRQGSCDSPSGRRATSAPETFPTPPREIRPPDYAHGRGNRVLWEGSGGLLLINALPCGHPSALIALQ